LQKKRAFEAMDVNMLPAELIAINFNIIGYACMRCATLLSESNLSGIAINATFSYSGPLMGKN
jgi:hypothetical protein